MPEPINARQYGTLAILIVAAIAVLSACEHWPNKRLSSTERKTCLAEGGYESRSVFGYPICQLEYSDAGKSCRDESECRGGCLANEDGGKADLSPGALAVGTCQPLAYYPGCHAWVVDGKVGPYGVLCGD